MCRLISGLPFIKTAGAAGLEGNYQAQQNTILLLIPQWGSVWGTVDAGALYVERELRDHSSLLMYGLLLEA